MSAGLRLALFGLFLVFVLAAGALVGSVAGPIDVGGGDRPAGHSTDGGDHG